MAGMSAHGPVAKGLADVLLEEIEDLRGMIKSVLEVQDGANRQNLRLSLMTTAAIVSDARPDATIQG
jgi:hypothetical protein